MYCKHCASPANSPENSDNEPEAALSVLTTNPKENKDCIIVPTEEVTEEVTEKITEEVTEEKP